MRRTLVVALLALLAWAGPAPAAVLGGPDGQRLHRAGRWLVDAQGRVWIGHGVNVVKKLAPYVRTEFTARDARALADQGFTTARIGFIWAGAEPKPGRYDERYIHRVLRLDDLLAHYGIRTMVDVHQDLWSKQTGGDGAPAWATLGSTFNDSFAAFWRDEKAADGVGIQTHFLRLWQHLARELRNHTNVMGLDPFNEPYPGQDYPCSPFTACPMFETGALASFYRRVIPAIRKGGAKQVIYPEAIAQSGVVAPSLPGFADRQTGFHYHFYCNVTQTSSEESGVSDHSLQASLCLPVEQHNLGNYHDYTRGLGVPAYLGEFSCNDVQRDNAQVVDITDEAFDSWAIWAYYTAADDPADCPKQGLIADDKKPARLKPAKLDALVVPHAQAIAGTPQSTAYDRDTARFTLTYGTRAVPGARLARGALTQVFVPARVYSSGYAVRATGARVVSGRGAPWLLLRLRRGAATVSVTVTRARGGKTLRPLQTKALPLRRKKTTR